MSVHSKDRTIIEGTFFALIKLLNEALQISLPSTTEDILANFQDDSYLLGLQRGRAEGLARIIHEQAKNDALIALMQETPYCPSLENEDE